MAGYEGKESPTPSEQGDYEDEGNMIEHEEAQEFEQATLNDQHREHESQITNDDENLNAATVIQSLGTCCVVSFPG